MATDSPLLICNSMADKMSSVPAVVCTRMPRSLATIMLLSGVVMKPCIRLLCIALLLSVRPVLADTLLVIGDSLSAAFGMPVEQGWVELLRRRMAESGRDEIVINDSISGDTTASALARLPQALERHQPDLVIVELGGNDGLRALSLTQMKQNLSAIVDRVLDGRRRLLLIGVELPPNYGRRYTEKFHAIYRELAMEKAVALVPSMVEGVGVHPELMQTDGIHPNAQAQPLIAAKVWRRLRPMLISGEGDMAAEKTSPR